MRAACLRRYMRINTVPCNGLSKIDWAELLRGARLINRGDDHRWNGVYSMLRMQVCGVPSDGYACSGGSEQAPGAELGRKVA